MYLPVSGNLTVEDTEIVALAGRLCVSFKCLRILLAYVYMLFFLSHHTRSTGRGGSDSTDGIQRPLQQFGEGGEFAESKLLFSVGHLVL